MGSSNVKYISRQKPVDFGSIIKKVFDIYKSQGALPEIIKRMYNRYLEVTTEDLQNRKLQPEICDWKCLAAKGLQVEYADFGVLQWMLHSNGTTTVLFWPEAVSDTVKMEVARSIVSLNCGQIIYEKKIVVNQNGLASLAFHAYGQHSWLDSYVKQLRGSFTGELKYKMAVLVMFVNTTRSSDLEVCKSDIRRLFSLTNPKSAVHIPDYHSEAVLISEMVLNPNSVMFLNHHHGNSCRTVSTEIGRRLNLSEVNKDIYDIPQNIMVDSGAVMAFFGIRQADDVDLLIQGPVDKSILGQRNGMSLSRHTDRSMDNLFLDPANHGYCHGIKFLSLQQLMLYKKRRGARNKDDVDVAKILSFLKSTSQNQMHGS